MPDMNEEEWMQLCLKAMAANDPDTLTQVILDINRMLYLKQQYLKDQMQASRQVTV